MASSETTLGTGKDLLISPQEHRRSFRTGRTVPHGAQGTNVMIQHGDFVRNLLKRAPDDGSGTGVLRSKPGTGVQWLKLGNVAPSKGH